MSAEPNGIVLSQCDGGGGLSCRIKKFDRCAEGETRKISVKPDPIAFIGSPPLDGVAVWSWSRGQAGIILSHFNNLVIPAATGRRTDAAAAVDRRQLKFLAPAGRVDHVGPEKDIERRHSLPTRKSLCPSLVLVESGGGEGGGGVGSQIVNVPGNHLLVSVGLLADGRRASEKISGIKIKRDDLADCCAGGAGSGQSDGHYPSEADCPKSYKTHQLLLKHQKNKMLGVSHPVFES